MKNYPKTPLQIITNTLKKNTKMSKTNRGVRDGSGPFKGSYQESTFGIGRRQQAGEVCPYPTKSNIDTIKKKVKPLYDNIW